MTASMDYGYDDDLGLLDSKVDSEGEARQQRAACIAMNYRVRHRLFGNELEGSKRFVQELVAETLALLLVP